MHQCPNCKSYVMPTPRIVKTYRGEWSTEYYCGCCGYNYSMTMSCHIKTTDTIEYNKQEDKI